MCSDFRINIGFTSFTPLTLVHLQTNPSDNVNINILSIKKPPPYAKNNVKNFIYKLNKPLHYNKLVLFN